MNKIKILPDFIANQIAAGEVVQRPESVVKELVENSFDSGADTIAVIVKGAGKQLIHIVDNGCGMSKEDLLLSCKRHATSKIFFTEDLEEINTFGFRGEALASISSVANVEIRTKQKEEIHGWKLTIEPNKEEIIEPCICDNGTQVFVKNLFYNVPARRKFLKTNLTEFRYISDTMIKLGLSKPDIRFTFYDEDTLIFDAFPSSLDKRIEYVLGESISKSIIPIEIITDDVQVSGYIGHPQIAKQSRSSQYFFLNNRSIISKSLGHAVYSAYEHLLENNSHPFFLINININTKKVDVNVHPQKHEVKFEDERIIYKAINIAVIDGLRKNNLAHEIRFDSEMSKSPFQKMNLSSVEGRSDDFLVNRVTGEVLEFKNNFERNKSYNNPTFQNYESKPKFNPDNLKAFDVVFGKTNEQSSFDDSLSIQESENIIPNKILLIHKKYIILQTESGLRIIDQHAAHERVLYEKAIKAMNKQFAYSQELLYPLRIKLNPSEITLLNELGDDLINLGFGFEKLSENEIQLTSVPYDIVNNNEIKAFKEILEQYEEEQKITHSNKRDKLAATYSCKAAIKTGQESSNEEIITLINRLMKCDMPYSCPHGRPIIIDMTLTELDKRFGRI